MQRSVINIFALALSCLGLAACGGGGGQNADKGGTQAVGGPLLARPVDQTGGPAAHPNLVVVYVPDGATRFTPVMPVNGVHQAVHDGQTGLTWELTAGQARSPGGLSLPTSKFDWYKAQELCFKSATGGRYGWRLPEIHELASLKNAPGGVGVIPTGHPFQIGGENDWDKTMFWSATPYLAPIAGATSETLSAGNWPSDKPSIRAWALEFGSFSTPAATLKVAAESETGGLMGGLQKPFAMSAWCVRDD